MSAPPAEIEVLLLAAGEGRRLGLGPKAFVELGGRTLLEWACGPARELAARLTVALPAGSLADSRRLLPPGSRVIEGGRLRGETLARLFEQSRAELLLVHDVAHPLASSGLFRSVLEATIRSGAALPALVPGDFVYRAEATGMERVPGAWLAQSPKGFRRDVLARALELQSSATPEEVGVIELALAAGADVTTVPGEAANIKITTAEDLRLAGLLSGRPNSL